MGRDMAESKAARVPRAPRSTRGVFGGKTAAFRPPPPHLTPGSPSRGGCRQRSTGAPRGRPGGDYKPHQAAEEEEEGWEEGGGGAGGRRRGAAGAAQSGGGSARRGRGGAGSSERRPSGRTAPPGSASRRHLGAGIRHGAAALNAAAAGLRARPGRGSPPLFPGAAGTAPPPPPRGTPVSTGRRSGAALCAPRGGDRSGIAAIPIRRGGRPDGAPLRAARGCGLRAPRALGCGTGGSESLGTPERFGVLAAEVRF